MDQFFPWKKQCEIIKPYTTTPYRHDVLMFPSARPEGLPLTMVKAMMAGCCITAGSGGAAEVIIDAELPIFALDNPVHLKYMLLELEKIGDDG